MATLTLTATESSVRARLTGLQKGADIGYPRSFEMTLKRGSMFVDYYETSLSATSTSTSVSHNFTGLASNTTYTVQIEVYNSNTGSQVAYFEDDITTDSPSIDYADIVCIVYTNGGQAKQGVWEDRIVGNSYTYNNIISNTVGSLPSGYNLDHYSWNGSTTTATSFTLPSNGGLLAIYLVSPTPTYYTMTIQVYIDDVRQSSYDGSIRRESGTTMSAEEWVSQSSVSVPSRYEFGYLEINGTPYNRYSLQSNVTAKAYFATPFNPIVITSASVSPSSIVSGGQITISWSYTGDKDSSGSWYLYRTDSSSFTSPTGIGNPQQTVSSFTMNWGPTGTYYIWVRYYGSSQGFSDVKSAGMLTVTETPTGKAYIYDNNQWKLATAYIYDGNTWKEAMPNIYDGGTWK